MQGAAKVGALVVVFIVLLYGAYSILGEGFGRKEVVYYADFNNVAGVTPGTKVLLAGVQVGTVTEARLLDPSLARLVLTLDEKTKIPLGSTAVIPASLIALGENPVQIVPPERPTTETLEPGGVLAGRLAGPLENVLPNSEETVKELTATLAATRKLLEDQELKNDIKQLLKTSDKTLQEFGNLANQSQLLLAENRGAIDRAMREASFALTEVRRGTEMVTRILEEGKFENEALTLLKRLNTAGARAEELVLNLNQLVTDPKIREPINETLANTAKISESGTRIAANAEQVSARAVELADEAKEIAQEVKTALKDVRGFFGRGNRGRSLGPIKASMDLIRETDPGYWRTDLEVDFGLGGSRYRLGLWDAFESNRLIVQAGRDAGRGLSYRYGIFAGAPGVGVDYSLADRVDLRGDLFDINDPRFDLRARFELGKGLYGWLGVNRVFDKNAPMIGIGVQK